MASQANLSSPDSLIDNQAGIKYWENANADVNGMLGGIPGFEGFGSISRVDLQGSRTFLARLGIGVKNGRNLVASALDGGAGYVLLAPGRLQASLMMCDEL